MSGITIEGLDDCFRCIDKAPENLNKMTRVAMKAASSVVVKHIKIYFPKGWQSLVKSKILTTTNGDITALIGAFNTKKMTSEGKKSFDWFKAYWKNYGTLKGRDPNHVFDYPIKRVMKKTNVRRRNSGNGIRHDNFFERAVAGTESMFIDALSKSLVDQNGKMYDR